MFERLFHRDTRREINQGIEKLKVSIIHIKALVTQDGSQSGWPYSDRMALVIQDMQRVMREISKEHARTGRVPIVRVKEIRNDLGKLNRLISNETRKPQDRPKSARSSMAALLHACAIAHVACSRLYTAVARLEKQQREEDPRFEDARSLRTALVQVDRAVGRGADLLALDQWLNTAPSTDWRKPEQILRLAQIYALTLVPGQSWDVHYRSRAPGHPLVFVAKLSRFPNLDDLDYMSQQIGVDVELFVAASRPRWRLVWQFSVGTL